MAGRHRFAFCAALLLALQAVLLAWPARADDAKPLRGVALVIGESHYLSLPALPNPANDARAVAQLLTSLGFEVSSIPDGDGVRLARGLKHFVEDAAGADVALLYYSGHGIEAAGENYLVPVEADATSLADPANRLVRVSALLAELKASVPVAIMLLDACRSNPFPPGATLNTPSGPAAVAAAGLDLARGAAPLADASGAPESLGEVIGFAAAPGHAALDGEAGGNSPYAAALLKHLAAGGFAFGDVMTMVTEEVYVKTGGRQLPWTNASLRRLLYFGQAPEETGSDEASIRSARRKLLLTIATTPADQRAMVETVAAQNEVPLDQLYGMLGALRIDTSAGPADLQAQLAAGAQKLREIITRHDTETRQDPELIRLSGLADRAQTEGAIQLALTFRAKASARAEEIDKQLDEAEADIRQRRLELANTFADHARTAILNFDYRTAAERYEDAFRQAERWDPKTAFIYKIFEGDALTDQGMIKGENAALSEAVDVYEAAKLLPGVTVFTGGPAGVAINEGITLTALAARENGTARVEQAIKVYEDALEIFSRKRTPQLWATVLINLGNAYDLMGQRAGGTAYYAKAMDAYRQATKVYTKKTSPDEWAGLQNNIGNEFTALGDAGDARKNYTDAIDAFHGALTVWTRGKVPVQWAMAMANMAVALQKLGEIEDGTEKLEASRAAFQDVLEVRTRETQPVDWANTQSNLGAVLLSLGQRGKCADCFEQALAAFDRAHEVITRKQDPFTWATITYNQGRAYRFMGDAEDSVPRYRKALEQMDLALTELTREKSPIIWGKTHSVRGEILLAIGTRTHDRASLLAARDAFIAARDIFRQQHYAQGFEGFYEKELGLVEQQLAMKF
ncbi:caspase family protein [Mesorhizobium sp. B2-3-4]|uniref:caspase family protein n=1 Tax=Mesorhizobium sp. B2-3-4 TaxID=2589959 RepID=UPI001129BE58|nr:caspase family protein [Mesorhizobium sp. B2-3-4]TPM34241.1 tetratricopeptide repeat protein [Mesorhizobium sp. B2-3-4]